MSQRYVSNNIIAFIALLLGSYPFEALSINSELGVPSISSTRDLNSIISSVTFFSVSYSIISNKMEDLKPSAVNSSPLTPLMFLQRAATVYANSVSVVYNETRYTWFETYTRCCRLASSLVTMGIGRGDVVSVLAPNVPAMYEVHFGVPMAGAILNNLNTRLDANTVSALLRHSGSKLVLVDCLLKSLAVEAIGLFLECEIKPALVTITDEYESEESNSLTAPFSKRYEDLVRSGDSEFKWLMPESEWDPIILNYSSGTTSSPKGVVHCHRAMFVGSVDSLLDWSVPKQPTLLWTLPMFHANGWTYTWGSAAVAAVNVCMRKCDAECIYELIDKHNVTHMCGAPVILNMLSSRADAKPLKHEVHVMTAGASPPTAVLLRAEALGFVVSHGYGLTETAGIIVSCAWKHEWNRLPVTEKARLKARQGVSTLRGTKIDVVDPVTRTSVPRDGTTIGEIVLQGVAVMLGYLKDPVSTAKAISNGWFYTGDLAVMHEDGYVEIKDRTKDIIITGGENVSSVEVESVIFMNPTVNEVAVVARPDEFWGETPCAFVNLKSGLRKVPCEKELIEYCRARMPHYMAPKMVVFMEELPKTSTGKIQKFVLREMARGIARPTMQKSRL